MSLLQVWNAASITRATLEQEIYRKQEKEAEEWMAEAKRGKLKKNVIIAVIVREQLC